VMPAFPVPGTVEKPRRIVHRRGGKVPTTPK